jgi:uncharacterized membrane protein YhaH (DUF805 family)
MGTVLWVLLSPRGRMNRREFATVFLGGITVLVLLVILGASLFDSLHLSKDATDIPFALFFGGLLFWKYIAIVGLVKRLHDMSASGMWWLLLFVPLAGLILYLIALLAGGAKSENRYGSPSRFFEPRILRKKLIEQPVTGA